MSTDVITTRLLRADAAEIAAAADCLRAGGLVAFPTETVYGLGADARNGTAVARLYAAKKRPRFNPLIAHVADAQAAKRLAHFNAVAERLAAAFWPGPLTLVLPLREPRSVASLATASLDSVAVRVSAHPVAQKILRAFGAPVVAPSANISGHVSSTTAAHVMADLDGRIDLVIDAGPANVGVESTIVACLGDTPSLLRPGGIDREAIEPVLDHALAQAPQDLDDALPRAPGMLASHYAPRAKLRLNAEVLHPGEALLAFGNIMPRAAEQAAMVLNLSQSGDLVEAAANLFAHLRRLDAIKTDMIAVSPIPDQGLGEAINDRLRRAAAPR